MSRIGKCRRCPALVRMLPYIKFPHKFAPIEVQPSEDGNVTLTGDYYEIVPKQQRELYKQRGFNLYKNHFASCEYAKSFAKRVQARKLPANVVRFPR